MVAVPQNIMTQLVSTPHDTRLAQCLIGAIDLAPDESLPWSVDNADPAVAATSLAGGAISDASVAKSYLALQYWPESIQDSRGSEWNPRNIPGGSHPIYQWTHGGERRLSFTAVFTTDTAPTNEALAGSDPYEDAASNPLGGINKGTRDLDIRAAINWLRYFTYPKYGRSEDLRVYEPPKCILVMPNSHMGYDGSDYVVAVMTQCDVTYEAFFPNGFPRIAEVQVEFAETVQYGGRVRFHDRRNMLASQRLPSYLAPRTNGGSHR
jgi:hypothetical protein